MPPQGSPRTVSDVNALVPLALPGKRRIDERSTLYVPGPMSNGAHVHFHVLVITKYYYSWAYQDTPAPLISCSPSRQKTTSRNESKMPGSSCAFASAAP